MTWDDAQALHIYAPPREPFADNWVEQILGEVVAPLAFRHGEAISWIWVTRYAGTYMPDQPPQGVPLPDEFAASGFFRYIVLRLHAAPPNRAEVHAHAIDLARVASCFIEPRGWFPYDPVQDLGGNRFIRDDAEPPARSERARLVLTFMDATVRLMLHSLASDDRGRWNIEPNMLPQQNRHGSFFESIHHLFCNATGVPTTVLVGGEWTQLRITTWWMHEPAVIAGEPSRAFDTEVRVRY